MYAAGSASSRRESSRAFFTGAAGVQSMMNLGTEGRRGAGFCVLANAAKDKVVSKAECKRGMVLDARMRPCD